MNFNGRNIELSLDLSIEDSLFEKKMTQKTLEFSKEVICSTCNGSREKKDSKGSNCYSCKGTGIRKDPLFHKEARCNTCRGFGSLVKDAC